MPRAFYGKIIMEVKNLSANLEAKKQVVEEIKEKINASKSVVLVNYGGLTVEEDTKFRADFRKVGVEYKVLKNTLVRRAFNELGVNSFDEALNGTTSVAFCKDETSAAKVIAATASATNDKISAKSAFVDGAYADAATVKMLASIPSKEVLYAKLAGGLKGIIGSVAVALNRVAENKAKENA